MREPLTLILSCGAGGGLGLFFFASLWWTVRKGLSAKQPALWFLLSLLARMSITVAGFYLVAGGHGARLLSCLLGFVIASVIVTRLIRASGARATSPEPSHAPQL